MAACDQVALQLCMKQESERKKKYRIGGESGRRTGKREMREEEKKEKKKGRKKKGCRRPDSNRELLTLGIIMLPLGTTKFALGIFTIKPRWHVSCWRVLDSLQLFSLFLLSAAL